MFLLKIFTAIIAITFTQLSSATPISGVDRILALVNNEIILKSELERELSTIVQRLEKQGVKLPPMQALAQQVLDKMISEELQLQAAKKAGIIIDESTVDSALQRIAKRNKLTLSQFREALSAQGVEYLNFRDNLKKEITLERLKVKKVENKVTVSDDAAKRVAKRLASDSADSMRRYRLGHILIPLEEAPSPKQIKSAKTEAADIVKQLQTGAEFSQIALEQSSGANALEGGTLDWLTRDELPSLFSQQIPALEIKLKNSEDNFIGPLRSASGFHLLSLLGTKEQTNEHLVTLTRASHILFKNSQLKSEEERKARLEIIRERAVSGENFAELALSNSEDGSAKDGGDLGWQNPANLVPEFVKEMNKLEIGEISEVFKSRFGWHIIKLIERKQEDNTEEFLISQARQMIRKRKISEATETWLRRLRDDAYVEYRLDDI
jgi:peptidyl-prolyl cis-trans isomerase SurA